MMRSISAKLRCVLMAGALLPASLLDASRPSFDCAKARGLVERAVCASEELAQLDQTLADAYRSRESAGGDASALRATQRDWLAARQAICFPSGRALPSSPRQACLALLYRNRIAELKAGASAAEYWQAESKTAMAITGDLLLSGTKAVMAGGYELMLQHVRSLPADQAVAMSGFDDARSLDLYRVVDGRPSVLLNGNELCGAQQTATYVVVAQAKDGNSLDLAFFSGTATPVWEKAALGSTHDLCGTYGYSRAAVR